MRQSRPRFTLHGLMLAVAAVALVCWVWVVAPAAIVLVLLFLPGPVIGASWATFRALRRMHPAVPPGPSSPSLSFSLWPSAGIPRGDTHDRLDASVMGGLAGGVFQALGIALLIAAAFAFESSKGQHPFYETAFVFGVLFSFWLLASLSIGVLVGVLVGLLVGVAALCGWEGHRDRRGRMDTETPGHLVGTDGNR